MPSLWANSNVENHKLNEIEKKIVQLYSGDRCKELLKEILPEDLPKFRPNILALIASCDPHFPNIKGYSNATEIFERAIILDPDNDLVRVLYGIYLSKRNDPKATDHWRWVLMVARNEFLRSLAREVLNGVPPPEKPLQLSPITWSAQGSFGLELHTAPWFVRMPELRSQDSISRDYWVDLNAQKWTNFGSISAKYELNGKYYNEATYLSTQVHRGELPVAIRVGTHEDFIFNPFLEYSLISGSALSWEYGLAIRGAIYRQNYKQVVSGFVSSLDTVIPDISSPRDSHYHFDYAWEYLPSGFRMMGKFNIDNYSASRTDHYRTVQGDFNNSHTDIGIDGFIRKRLQNGVTLGLRLMIGRRFDAHESKYFSKALNCEMRTQREDRLFTFEPYLLYRLLDRLELKTYYRRDTVKSNIGRRDYGIDRSNTDNVYGIELSSYWSSY